MPLTPSSSQSLTPAISRPSRVQCRLRVRVRRSKCRTHTHTHTHGSQVYAYTYIGPTRCARGLYLSPMEYFKFRTRETRIIISSWPRSVFSSFASRRIIWRNAGRRARRAKKSNGESYITICKSGVPASEKSEYRRESSNVLVVNRVEVDCRGSWRSWGKLFSTKW